MNLLQQVINEYKESLNPSSKWYNDDLNSFVQLAKLKSKKELLQQLTNIRALNGKNYKFNAVVKTEMNKMERHGMYEMSNMKTGNALD